MMRWTDNVTLMVIWEINKKL